MLIKYALMPAEYKAAKVDHGNRSLTSLPCSLAEITVQKRAGSYMDKCAVTTESQQGFCQQVTSHKSFGVL